MGPRAAARAGPDAGAPRISSPPGHLLIGSLASSSAACASSLICTRDSGRRLPALHEAEGMPETCPAKGDVKPPPLRMRVTGASEAGRAGVTGRCAGATGDQLSPTISPFSSRSIRAAAGFVPSPGMVRISPQIGYTNPAPTEARTSRTGSVQPVGAPLSVGSDDMDRCVFAMHTGSVPNPAASYVASCLLAWG